MKKLIMLLILTSCSHIQPKPTVESCPIGLKSYVESEDPKKLSRDEEAELDIAICTICVAAHYDLDSAIQIVNNIRFSH
jgi:hypothetical protein